MTYSILIVPSDEEYQEQPPTGVAVDHPDCCRAVSLRFLPGAI
jgi:hypothetical protein